MGLIGEIMEFCVVVFNCDCYVFGVYDVVCFLKDKICGFFLMYDVFGF